MENKSLKEIEEFIKKYTDDAFIKKVSIEKMNKDVLFVVLDQSTYKVMLFEESNGMKEIGIIRYAVRGEKVFISEFEVNEKYQGNGLGRLLFDFALAHADTLGVSYAFGCATPTSNIKGITGTGLERYKKEKQAIYEIYKKLGCNFDNPANDTEDDPIFDQTWVNGEKFKSASPIVCDLVLNYKEQSKEMI